MGVGSFIHILHATQMDLPRGRTKNFLSRPDPGASPSCSRAWWHTPLILELWGREVEAEAGGSLSYRPVREAGDFVSIFNSKKKKKKRQ